MPTPGFLFSSGAGRRCLLALVARIGDDVRGEGQLLLPLALLPVLMAEGELGRVLRKDDCVASM